MDLQLRLACFEGNIDYIKERIESRKKHYAQYEDKYINPVFFCACRGHLDCVKYLIKIIPTSKSTVISSIKMAAIENHLEIVEFFFQYVKEYDKTDFHLISALKGCIEKKQRNIINYLLEKDIFDEDEEESTNAFTLCAKLGDLETMLALSKKYQDFTKFIPISIELAIKNNHQEITCFLMNIKRN